MSLQRSMSILAWLILSAPVWGADPDTSAPWGEPNDGISGRLLMRPRYALGEPISATIEIKNASGKRRFIDPQLDPREIEWLTLDVAGPKGKLEQTLSSHGYSMELKNFKAIEPDEVMRFEVADLRRYFENLRVLSCDGEQENQPVATGKYTLKFVFRSPEIPNRFGKVGDVGGKGFTSTDTPKELLADQWSKEATSPPVKFELAELGKDDLVVHEWGVFSVYNEAKYANIASKEEWNTLPRFFYRQFPNQRLRWIPTEVKKPIVYFYAKPERLQLEVEVTFAEGAPVVWWPAVAEPLAYDGPNGRRSEKAKIFRSLTWNAWLGEHGRGQLGKVQDFPLPDDCWVKDARLPGASQITVVGSPEESSRERYADSCFETERFLYYDGLVPAPDYLRCEKSDADSVTLRNTAKFDIQHLVVVDRRSKEAPGFAYLDGKDASFKAGTSIKVQPKRIAAKDWPSEGIKQARQALVDAGLFGAEADALLKIWKKRFFDADGITAFHILPVAEYDRMLPLRITAAPTATPVRVGIALHPHLESEPKLQERVGELIKVLDSEDFEKRTAASKELLEIGPLAISLLREELKKRPSLEVAKRIEDILERVDATDWLKLPDGKGEDGKGER